MKKNVLRMGLALGAAFWALTPAAAETFKIQTLLGSNATTTKALEKMATELKEATGGQIAIQVLAAGAVVAATETLDAVRAGVLDGHHSSMTYFAGKDPALGVFGDTLSAYPDTDTRNSWFAEGGGKELATKLYAKYGMQYVCNSYWPVEQIPSTRAINGVADFKGLRIRSPGGLATDLLTRAGASLVTMSVADSVIALETGVLDATDLANITLNNSLGLYSKARFSILARHSMGVIDLAVSKRKWDALSSDAKTKFVEACNKMSAEVRTSLIAEDEATAKKLRADGVTLIEFGEKDQQAFRALAMQVWQDWGARSAEAKAIVDSHRAYMTKLGLK